jgi:hypothetical protein
MVLRLAERLEVPLRTRNEMLLAAGFAPEFPERSLDSAALSEARRAIELVLQGHMPFPALAVDRHWNLIGANPAATGMLTGIARVRCPDQRCGRASTLRAWRRARQPGGVAGPRTGTASPSDCDADPELNVRRIVGYPARRRVQLRGRTGDCVN